VTAAEPYRRARLGLGYVPQGREIFPGLTFMTICVWEVHQARRAEQDTIAGWRNFPALKGHFSIVRAGAPYRAGEQQPAGASRAACAASRVSVLLDEPTEVFSPRSSTRLSRPSQAGQKSGSP